MLGTTALTHDAFMFSTGNTFHASRNRLTEVLSWHHLSSALRFEPPYCLAKHARGSTVDMFWAELDASLSEVAVEKIINPIIHYSQVRGVSSAATLFTCEQKDMSSMLGIVH